MFSLEVKILLIICLQIFFVRSDVCNKIYCQQAKNCHSCLRLHHCCEWCYDQEFKGCYRQNTSGCKPESIQKNTPSSVEIIKDEPFSNVQNKEANHAIQFKPSEFNVNLRAGEPIEISFAYQPARNYPLDLYYLMDLTYSMHSDLQILTSLGSELTSLLSRLTKFHRIAFGSYVDKPEMPFYGTEQSMKDNPCQGGFIDKCEKGYLFKHKLNFTDQIEEFIAQVNSSRLSANYDDPEGGLDALMQIILCHEKVGWKPASRKLVIIATGGSMHLAGEGILAGHILRNTKFCQMDSNGNYFSKVPFDYPSLEEIYYQLKKNKINIILAAKSSILDYYNKMQEMLKETMFVEELTNNRTKVLNVLKEGYYSFIRKVNLFINTTSVDGLKADFYADCNGDGEFEKTHNCENAQEGKMINFKMRLFLEKCQKKDSETLYIEESNINDTIPINLKFVGSKCICSNMKSNFSKNCINGKFDCGDCVCAEGWTGKSCSQECKNDISKCYIKDGNVLIAKCSERGECICSKCVCDAPYYKGEFCQYTCPYNKFTKEICEGHGECINGSCECYDNYIGKNCGCHNSTEYCKIPGDKSNNLCNNHGDCNCNKCNCHPGYSGKYCEECGNCDKLCPYYEDAVRTEISNKTSQKNDKIKVQIVAAISDDNRMCVFNFDKDDGGRCIVYFNYKLKSKQNVDINAMMDCSQPLGASTLVGVIIGSFLFLAFLIAICWKGRNMYADKKEFERFEKERKNYTQAGENPLYQSPWTSYKKPEEFKMHEI